jgi:wobble nucleotide-excising tRNase
MIMLERILLIENTGNYCRVQAGQIAFSDVNIIYGENRNGKSTLCDIFYSLCLDEPRLITDRKSIIQQREPAQVTQNIKIKFSGKREPVEFLNNAWTSKIPECSVLHVFDQNFIHRNVMTGMSYSRENSTNISSFILGENSEKFVVLESKNQKIRDDKKSLGIITNRFNSHNINNIDTFITLPLSNKTLEELNEEIQSSKRLQQELNTQIYNVTQVTSRTNLETISRHKAINTDLQSINKCLDLNMENIHQASKAAVNTHKTNVDNTDTFDGWAARGVIHLKDDCPFCGQELEEGASALIDSYKTAFNNSFQTFISSTRTNVNQIQRNTLINSNIGSIKEQHERNLACLETYVEEDIRKILDEQSFIQLLSDSFEHINHALTNLHLVNDKFAKIVNIALTTKLEAPYNAIDAIDFTELQNVFSEFDGSITQYNAIKTAINNELTQFKESQDATALRESKSIEARKEVSLENTKRRLVLNADCINFSNLNDIIISDLAAYNTEKAALEADQDLFLDTYFNEINSLFRRIGSSDFDISRSINRVGARTVYDLKVSFKGRDIDKTKFHCLFSESDRRSLALCIFFAKINQLPVDEKEKAILVMDDPVTSFDNERISNILQILQTLEASTKQIIITTHYKGMASAVMKKFNEAKALKIVQTANGSIIEETTKAEMTATAHDERYTEIMDFVEFRTRDNKITKLRQFVEDEMRQRYKLPLTILNLNERTSFNDCIVALEENSHITNSAAVLLHDYRTSLNIPSHELELRSLEGDRNYAKAMMEFIYNDL